MNRTEKIFSRNSINRIDRPNDLNIQNDLNETNQTSQRTRGGHERIVPIPKLPELRYTLRYLYDRRDKLEERGVKTARMTSVRTLLAKYSISPAKRLGQHFLMDKGIMMAIIRTADVNPQDMVLEVGPGLGEMTELLASKAWRNKAWIYG